MSHVSGNDVHEISGLSLLAASAELAEEDRPPLPLLEGQWAPWTDYAPIQSALAHGNVSAPAEYVAPLEQVVADAAKDGIDLKIVITEDRGVAYPQARDLATRIALEHPESTIFVRTPAYIGSHSDHIPRARLEAAQDDAYRKHDPVSAATVFEHHISRPPVQWAPYAAVVIVLVVVSVAAFAYLIRRRAQRGH